MTYDHITLETVEAVATLTFNRPEKLNALSLHSLSEIIDAVDTLRDTGEARVLLLTGAGRAFCSGADLSGGADDRDPPDVGAGLESHFNPLLERLAQLPIPIVTAINGLAAGGGCGYALAGDIVVAARSAYFLLPFANIGLVPDVGATWVLPRLIGKARATAMMMLGERVSAEQACEWGMIYKMVEDAELASTSLAIAAQLAKGPTRAFALMRQAIQAALEQGLTETLAMERRNQRLAGLTADHAEGVQAFLQKRKAGFQGR